MNKTSEGHASSVRILKDVAELKRLAEDVKQWGSANKAWQLFAELEPNTAAVGDEFDGEKYPVATVDCDQYYADADSLKLAKFYAAANPAVILELLAQRDELLAALEGIVNNRDKNAPRQEKYVSQRESNLGPYWSPAATMVDSEVIAAARAAIAKVAK